MGSAWLLRASSMTQSTSLVRQLNEPSGLARKLSSHVGLKKALLLKAGNVGLSLRGRWMREDAEQSLTIVHQRDVTHAVRLARPSESVPA